MPELDDLKAEWIAAEQAADNAWSAVVALPEGKAYRELRKKAWEAQKRYHAAWIASLQTKERTTNEETVQG